MIYTVENGKDICVKNNRGEEIPMLQMFDTKTKEGIIIVTIPGTKTPLKDINGLEVAKAYVKLMDCKVYNKYTGQEVK